MLASTGYGNTETRSAVVLIHMYSISMSGFIGNKVSVVNCDGLFLFWRMYCFKFKLLKIWIRNVAVYLRYALLSELYFLPQTFYLHFLSKTCYAEELVAYNLLYDLRINHWKFNNHKFNPLSQIQQYTYFTVDDFLQLVSFYLSAFFSFVLKQLLIIFSLWCCVFKN